MPKFWCVLTQWQQSGPQAQLDSRPPEPKSQPAPLVSARRLPAASKVATGPVCCGITLRHQSKLVATRRSLAPSRAATALVPSNNASTRLSYPQVPPPQSAPDTDNLWQHSQQPRPKQATESGSQRLPQTPPAEIATHRLPPTGCHPQVA